MDVLKIIGELEREKQRVEHTIARLERLQRVEGHEHGPMRRGRKSMGAGEPQQVSARMLKYWESRRNQSKADSLATVPT